MLLDPNKLNVTQEIHDRKVAAHPLNTSAPVLLPDEHQLYHQELPLGYNAMTHSLKEEARSLRKKSVQ